MNPVLTRRTRWQPFFNVSTAAAYHFELQQVTLDAVEDVHVQGFAKSLAPSRFRILPLAAHEYTHLLDHMTTLWGRELLHSFYEGLGAREAGDLPRFPAMVRARRAVHRSGSLRYFMTLGPRAGYRGRWVWALSVGLRFNSAGELDPNQPIPFVRFGHGDPNKDENRVARVPISAAALSELRATAAEFRWIAAEQAARGQRNTPATPLNWLAEYESQLYSAPFVLYSSALHLLANHCHVDSVADVIEHGSALAALALNGGPSLAGRLRLDESWTERWRPPHSPWDLVTPLLTSADPGFLYLALCSHAPPPNGKTLEEWLGETLDRAVGLSLIDVEVLCGAEWESQSARVGSLAEQQFQRWFEFGEQWRAEVGPLGSSEPLMAALEGAESPRLPAALTSDMAPWAPQAEPFEPMPGATILDRLDYMGGIVDSIDEFLDVCGL